MVVEPCSEVYDGDLAVCAHDCVSWAVSDADTLRNIRVVTGRLTIVRTDLVDLRAFECLEEIGGGLSIQQNSKLQNLVGLGKLRYQGQPEAPSARGIVIYDNPLLESLEGLTSLQETYAFDIRNNASLARLGLSQIERVNGLYLGWCSAARVGSSTEGDNPSLTTLDGFDSLVSLKTLSVSGQSGLTSITRLRELAESGVDFVETDFYLNPNLDTAEIDAFVDAAGSFGTVCENAGDDTICMCPEAGG